MKSVILSIAMGATLALAIPHVVNVGQNGNLFTPDQIIANVGDVVHFEFRSKNHSVAQASFVSPCVPIEPDGVWSGFQPVSLPVDASSSPYSGQTLDSQTANPQFTIVINNTAPLWFYCAQANHCQNGMVMAINVNASVQTHVSFADCKTDKTLAAFKSAAAKASFNVAPNFSPQGGTFEMVRADVAPTTSKGDINGRNVGAVTIFAIGALSFTEAFSTF